MTALHATLPTAQDFRAIRELLYQHTGIVLGDEKAAMVGARLSRRLAQLGCEDFMQYVALLADPKAGPAELPHMINCLTTNKTSFFREGHHFSVLKAFLLERAAKGQRKFRIWSAACSKGAEPYSMAIVVREAFPDLMSYDVRILASDVDTDVLAQADAGVYSASELEGLSLAHREAWLEKNGATDTWLVDRRLRDLVTFRQINFKNTPWPIKTKFDAIFCRNVMIYFDRETQRAIYEEQARLLETHGLFFAGHSENLHWMGHRFTPVGGTVYRVAGGDAASSAEAHSAVVASAVATAFPSAETKATGGSGTYARFVEPPPSTSAHSSPLVPSRRQPGAKNDASIAVGEVHASATPTIVRTVLGSCIAACVFDPFAKIGGMNHFMLPEADNVGSAGTQGLPTRFGVHAMELLINELLRLGADRHRLVAKVFGGASVLAGVSQNVGEQNCVFIRSFLELERIPVLAQRLGGELPLQVHFHTDTGQALVREVRREAPEIAKRDADYRRVIAERAVAERQDVTLF